LVIGFVFGRGCAAAGLSSGMFFMLVRMPPPAEAVRRSFEELSNTTQSRRARCGAAIKLRRVQEVGLGTRSRTQRAGRTDPDRLNLYRRAKWRFQVAGWRRRRLRLNIGGEASVPSTLRRSSQRAEAQLEIVIAVSPVGKNFRRACLSGKFIHLGSR